MRKRQHKNFSWRSAGLGWHWILGGAALQLCDKSLPSMWALAREVHSSYGILTGY
jgi:hypothetical protein